MAVLGRIRTYMRMLCRGEEAQDLVEYTLLLAFVALAGAAMYMGMSDSSVGLWSTVKSRLAKAGGP